MAAMGDKPAASLDQQRPMSPMEAKSLEDASSVELGSSDDLSVVPTAATLSKMDLVVVPVVTAMYFLASLVRRIESL